MSDADEVEMENWSFWSALAPELAQPKRNWNSSPVALSLSVYSAASTSMEVDGFLQMDPVFSPSEMGPIRDAIMKLESVGLPPVFIYIYEQPWMLFHRLRPLISHFLGDHFSLLPNFWAWHIPTVEGTSGWPRHRDCEGETRFENTDGSQTLMSMSLWLPLSDATVDNGCMHVLPRSWGASDDHQKGLPLPAQAGSVLGWAQDLEHWSGQVKGCATSPRISLSLEFQNAAFAPMAQPLLDLDAPPPFEQRLALIRQQIPKYSHLENPV